MLALGGANAAQVQITVNYTAGTFSYTAPSGDADFYGTARSQTLTLLPGVAQTINPQAVYLDAFETNDYNDFIDTISRSLKVNDVTHDVAQKSDLTTDYGDGQSTYLANDSLIFYPSSAVDFDLGTQGVVTFTPSVLGGNGIFEADSGKYFDNVKGTFLLTPASVPTDPVPEASTSLSFGLLLSGLSLGAVCVRRRRVSSRA